MKKRGRHFDRTVPFIWRGLKKSYFLLALPDLDGEEE
jgi:hypothetical protein